MSGQRSAALAGVLYVALDVVVGVTAGAPPPPSAPESEILAYLTGHRAGLAAGLWLFGLASILLLWWFGSLWARMVRAESGAARLAVVSLAGLLLGGTMSFASAVVLASLALTERPEAVVEFYTLGAVFLSTAGFGLGAHLVATNTLAVRHAMLPAWLVVTGLLSAVAFVVSAVLGAVSNDATSNTVSLVGFVLWLAWILGVSQQMWTDRARPHGQPAATGEVSGSVVGAGSTHRSA